MFKTMLATVFLLSAAALETDEATSTSMVSNAVTVEASSVVELRAEGCRLTFPLAAEGETAARALSNLGPAREAFTRAVKNAAGTAARIDFEEPELSWRPLEGEVPESFTARQEAVVEPPEFPSEAERRRELIGRIAAAAVDSRAVARECRTPGVEYLFPALARYEERLVSAAVENAARRVELTRRALGRKYQYVRAAHFPPGAEVNGELVPFADGQPRITAPEPALTATYTVRIAYALEL